MDYYDNDLSVYGLIRDLFAAAACGCFLLAIHRIARGVQLVGRVSAYDELADSYTAEEREVLIHRIKQGSMHR